MNQKFDVKNVESRLTSKNFNNKNSSEVYFII